MIPAPSGDTIFALSSGAPPAAIAIVRVSGERAGSALETLTGSLPRPRLASYRTIRGPEGGVIDKALVLWFPGTHTVTGEPLAELHLHGSRAVMSLVFEALAACGLRPAEPGEFTRRAFLNGRIDLTAAEGLGDLLEAETKAEHARAMRIAEGGLGRIVETWRTSLLMLAAEVESAIEFGETDDDAPDDLGAVRDGIDRLIGEMRGMLARPPAERLRDGTRVVIAGPPNLGKSSLLNVLAGREVALATPVPGTTRDVIEAPVRMGDHAVLLVDTAGLRDAGDLVERLGIERAHRVVADADLLLWCGRPEDCPAPDKSMMVRTRADEDDDEDGRLAVSIFDPASIDMLRRNIIDRISSLQGENGTLLLNQRQRMTMCVLVDDLSAARDRADIILVAAGLRMALQQVDRLCGRANVEDLLDTVFGRFCIGK